MTRSTVTATPEVWKLCPVCQRAWRPWAGSKLQSHAKCAMTPELQDDLLGVYEAFRPHLTEARMATDLGVTKSILRANLEAARRRRRETCSRTET